MVTALWGLIYAFERRENRGFPSVTAPLITLRLLTELSQIPVPLPSLTRRSLERFLELREGVNQESSAARQDRRWTRIADDWCVVGEDSK